MEAWDLRRRAAKGEVLRCVAQSLDDLMGWDAVEEVRERHGLTEAAMQRLCDEVAEEVARRAERYGS